MKPLFESPPSRTLPPLAWVTAALFFAVFLFLYTRGSDFPYIYERDGPSKIEQVMTGERNFRHPALMLNTAAVVAGLTNRLDSKQAVVEAGRFTSAMFVALGVAALSLAAWYLAGPVGALVAATVAGMHPDLVDLVHFFKEDATLIGCLSLVMLGITLVCKSPSRPRIVFLGAVSGLAIAAKYIGVTGAIAAGLALGLTLSRPECRGYRAVSVLLFILAMIATLALANYQTVLHPTLAPSGMEREMEDLTDRRYTEEVPYVRTAWSRLKNETSRWVFFFFGIELVTALRFRPRDQARLFLLGFPVAYWIMLMFSPHQFARYYLPVVFFMAFGAGLGLITVARLVGRLLHDRIKDPVIPILAGLLVIALSVGKTADVVRGFGQDTHRDLAEWIRQNVPHDAVIAQDARAFLTGRTDTESFNRIPQQVVSERQLSNLDSVEELEALNPDYLAVHELSSRQWLFPERFKDSKESKSFLADYNRKYGTTIWQSDGGEIGYMTPKLRLIRLVRSKHEEAE